MSKHTLFDLATDFDLFKEFADPHATWSEEAFNSKPASEKLRQLIVAFGVSDEERNELAANDLDGVYVCENPSLYTQRQEGLVVFTDMDFYDALAVSSETIYGNVSFSIAALIEQDYGIR